MSEILRLSDYQDRGPHAFTVDHRLNPEISLMDNLINAQARCGYNLHVKIVTNEGREVATVTRDSNLESVWRQSIEDLREVLRFLDDQKADTAPRHLYLL